MGGGDLNMKKSWHPLLLKNQERVWLEEKKALEEKKKLDQLRKEKEEERQLQELQRMQEEQTGKKRTEKLEWMYTTPATGTSQNPNDLEDYLLGKKRVDKILTADENAKLGASHKNFIAVQNANNARDIAAKIREDPLLAIKQQEQAAYQALMSNPLRLREMQERNGIKPKKEKKKDKHSKKKDKHKKDRSVSQSRSRRSYSERRRSSSRDRYSRSRRSASPYDRRSPSPRLSRYQHNHRHDRDRDYSTRGRSRSRTPDYPTRRREDSREDKRVHAWPKSDDSEDSGHARGPRSRSKEPSEPRGRYADNKKRRRSRSPIYHAEKRFRASPPPASSQLDRAARLAAMSSNASSLTVERKERLTAMLEKEKVELEAEDQARARSKGMGGFLSHEQKKVFGGAGGLEERIRRGRGGMVVDGE